MEKESNKMTAVQWLVKHLSERGYIQAPSFGHSIIDKAIKQAKQMEKEQIEDAYADGVDDEYEYHINNEPRKNTEEYYLKKYGKTFLDIVSHEESQVHEVVRKLKEKKN